MTAIPLSGRNGTGLSTIVDDDRAERLASFTWHLTPNGYVATSRVPRLVEWIGDGPFIVMMHRVVAGLFGRHDGTDVDHANMDRLDNRRENLRLGNRSLNMANQRARAKSGFKGVHWHAGRWSASITVNYRNIYLGRHDTAIEAAVAYNAAAVRYFGEFARLNDLSNAGVAAC